MPRVAGAGGGLFSAGCSYFLDFQWTTESFHGAAKFQEVPLIRYSLPKIQQQNLIVNSTHCHFA